MCVKIGIASKLIVRMGIGPSESETDFLALFMRTHWRLCMALLLGHSRSLHLSRLRKLVQREGRTRGGLLPPRRCQPRGVLLMHLLKHGDVESPLRFTNVQA